MKSNTKLRSTFLTLFWIFLILTPLNFINPEFSTIIFNRNHEYSGLCSLNNQNLKLSSGEVLYSENFDDGIAENWVVIGGSWTIESNQYKVVGNGEGRVRSYYNAQQFSDYTYEGDFKLIQGAEMQIIFNVQDIFDGEDMGHYCQITLFYDDGGGDRKDNAILYSTSNGQDEHIRIPFDFNYDQWYHFTIISTGRHVDFYLDGGLIISYEGVQYISGCIGLKAMYDPIAYIDNIKVLNGSVIPPNPITIILAIVIPIIAFISIAVVILRKKARKRKRQRLTDKVEVKLEDTVEESKEEITEEQKDEMKLMKEDVGETIQEKENEISISEPLILDLEEEKLEHPSIPEPRDLYPIPTELKEEEPVKLKALKPEKLSTIIGTNKEYKEETIKKAPVEEEKVIDKKVTHFCTNCGKPIINTWKICAYCGVSIRKDLWKTEIAVKKEKEPTEKELEIPIVESQKSSKIEEIKQEVIEEPKAPDISKTIEKEPVEPKILKNVCPFCGLENPLEQLRCKQCGYKLKKIV